MVTPQLTTTNLNLPVESFISRWVDNGCWVVTTTADASQILHLAQLLLLGSDTWTGQSALERGYGSSSSPRVIRHIGLLSDRFRFVQKSKRLLLLLLLDFWWSTTASGLTSRTCSPLRSGSTTFGFSAALLLEFLLSFLKLDNLI